MPFPKHKILADHQAELRLALESAPKKIGYSPMFYCEFFEGMEVLQVYGHESREYIFGLYYDGKYCGHVYFGRFFSWEKVQQVCAIVMPPTWDQIWDFVRDRGDVWYYKFHRSQYAWIYEQIIIKN